MSEQTEMINGMLDVAENYSLDDYCPYSHADFAEARRALEEFTDLEAEVERLRGENTRMAEAGAKARFALVLSSTHERETTEAREARREAIHALDAARGKEGQ